MNNSRQDILREHEWIVKVCNFLTFRIILPFHLGRLRIHEPLSKTVFAIYRKRLKKFYAPFREQFSRDYKTAPSSNNNIFILWLQGLDNAPEVVKKCIDSTVRNSNGFTVHIITQENLEQYTEGIPSEVLEKIFAGIKRQQGQINKDFNRKYFDFTIQYLSDLLRMWLLSHYGGLWVDATVYHTSRIELPYIDRYYTLRRPNGFKLNIGNGRWSTYYQYSPAGNIVTQFVYEALCYYAKNADFIMHYFLTDETIDYAYNNVDAIRQEIDSVPMSNLDVNSLVEILNQPWDESLYNKLTENTNTFKLSWKININYQDKNNFYAHLQ